MTSDLETIAALYFSGDEEPQRSRSLVCISDPPWTARELCFLEEQLRRSGVHAVAVGGHEQSGSTDTAEPEIRFWAPRLDTLRQWPGQPDAFIVSAPLRSRVRFLEACSLACSLAQRGVPVTICVWGAGGAAAAQELELALGGVEQTPMVKGGTNREWSAVAEAIVGREVEIASPGLGLSEEESFRPTPPVEVILVDAATRSRVLKKLSLRERLIRYCSQKLPAIAPCAPGLGLSDDRVVELHETAGVWMATLGDQALPLTPRTWPDVCHWLHQLAGQAPAQVSLWRPIPQGVLDAALRVYVRASSSSQRA